MEGLLRGWRRDRKNKVLIFTKSVKLLRMLEYHLQSQGRQFRRGQVLYMSDKCAGLGFVKLEGSTKPQDRE